jgi:hypothetical protein
VVALGGCTSGGADVVREQAWTQIDLPADFVGSNLLVVDGRLVVGGNTNDQPALLVAENADDSPTPGDLVPIPIEPVSFYGAKARWYSLVADGSHLRALGGRTGGGHGNPRWSTWVGDLEQFTEQRAQGMEVFGGWRGGGMVGVAVADGQAVIVGGRSGEQPGLDIAVWLEEGDDWVEQPSAGTALAAAPGVLPFPTGVVSNGGDLVITGYTQVLGGGEVRIQAAVWVGSTTEAGAAWQRFDLETDATRSSADAASCDAGRCVIVGSGDGDILAWSYADGTVQRLDLPEIEVGDDDIPAPVVWNGGTAIVAPDGDNSVVAVDDGGWSLHEGPAGVPIAAAAFGETLYVLTTDGGLVRLWSTTTGP